MGKKTFKLTDQIRKSMDDSGLTRYRISQATGIDESALSKFYRGTRGLSLESLDRLCDYLGLQVITIRRTDAKGK